MFLIVFIAFGDNFSEKIELLREFFREIVDFVQFSQKSVSKYAKNDKFHKILYQNFINFLWHLKPNAFWDRI